MLAFEASPSCLEPDDHQDDHGDRARQPQRHDRTGREDGDRDEDDLHRNQERDRLGRRPADGGEAVDQVITAMVNERTPSAEPVDDHARGVEQEDRQSDQGDHEVARRARHRLDGQRPDGEREADGESTAPPREQ